VGSERVDALDALRLRSSRASRLPSKFGVCVACVGKAGTMSFLAGPPCCRFVVELFVELGMSLLLLKSMVRALCEPRAGGGSGLLRLLPMRCTSTQSGSGLGVKGLLGRCGFGMCPSDGGWMRALAGRPLQDERPRYYREDKINTIVKPPLPPI